MIERPDYITDSEWEAHRAAKAANTNKKASNGLDSASKQPIGQPTTVTLQCAANVEVEPISWLWLGWLALGKVHIIGGQPGAGKTTIAMKMAATVSMGGCWPDDTKAPKGNVVIWSGEDNQKDTLVPRLITCGADLARIFFVHERGKRRAFDPSKDIEPLMQAIRAAGGAKLLIIDPMVSAVAGDSHKNAETRRSLQPLVDLASDVGAALLGVTHFTKGTGGQEPIERIIGSVAFCAVARVVLVAAKEQDGADGTAGRRVMARAKSNIGPDEGGFAYSLQLKPLPGNAAITSSIAVWGEPIEGTARDMLAAAESSDDDGKVTALREAKDFLLDFLMDGPKPAKEISASATGAAISSITLRRAKAELGITAIKDGMTGGWQWALPRSGSSPTNLDHHDHLDHLRQNMSTFEGDQQHTKMIKEKKKMIKVIIPQGAAYSDHLRDEGGTVTDGWEGEI